MLKPTKSDLYTYQALIINKSPTLTKIKQKKEDERENKREMKVRKEKDSSKKRTNKGVT